jgi:hypothetical protein
MLQSLSTFNASFTFLEITRRCSRSIFALVKESAAAHTSAVFVDRSA